MGLEIQYGRQNIILFMLSCHRSKICQKDIFFIFLLSPSLDLINTISVRALEAMKVADETLQRSWPTSQAASSYLQPEITFCSELFQFPMFSIHHQK